MKCLVHGDFHNENILFDHHHLVGLLDLEKFCIGNPFSDLMHFIRLACFNSRFLTNNFLKAKIFAQQYLLLRPCSDAEVEGGYMNYIYEQVQSVFLENLYLENRDPFLLKMILRDNHVLKLLSEDGNEIIKKIFK